ncbi:MAG: CPBP family intramembrane metalloprotease [Nitrospirae bacterium]|nr:CPBP family intramembrane metalloprotease [Nitrospirota bacterium]
MNRGKLLLMAALTEGGAFVLALGLTRVFHIDFDLIGSVIAGLTGNLIGGFLPVNLGVALAGAVLPLVLFIAMLSESAVSVPFVRSLRTVAVRDVRSLFAEARLADVAAISVVAGICEESLFRGVLQAKFGLIAASLVFGFLHFVNLAYFVFAVLMGFYLGWLFVYFKGLFVPVAVHFLYDFGALAYLLYVARPERRDVSDHEISATGG